MSKLMEKIQFIYFRNISNGVVNSHGGVTVVYLPGKYISTNKKIDIYEYEVAIGISVCSPYDNFNKEIGRGLAIKNAIITFSDGDVYDQMSMEEFILTAKYIYNGFVDDIIDKKETIHICKVKKLKNKIRQEEDEFCQYSNFLKNLSITHKVK